jgi:hypothetical protein
MYRAIPMPIKLRQFFEFAAQKAEGIVSPFRQDVIFLTHTTSSLRGHLGRVAKTE